MRRRSARLSSGGRRRSARLAAAAAAPGQYPGSWKVCFQSPIIARRIYLLCLVQWFFFAGSAV